MMKTISLCPACQNRLQITALTCPDCGMELRNTFNLSPFDMLDEDKTEFLLSFLRNRGNLKNVQADLQISYPTAKRKLNELLIALHLLEEEDPNSTETEDIDLHNLFTDHTSTKASEIIKAKLLQNGGRVIVHTSRGLPCEIRIASDGVSFISEKLPIKPPYRFDVFDRVVELLLKQDGKARKGNGRTYKLGDKNCDETTVVGYIAKHYAHKNDGDSVYDPVFVLAAVLEWADIARNERGELILTASYQAML